MIQQTLFDKPRAARSDKATQLANVLRRLRQSPASGMELLQAGGGIRFTSRIFELREAGYDITTGEKSADGTAIYTLSE